MRFFQILISIFVLTSASAQLKYGLRDEQGRHVVARGFVVTTNDGVGEVFFDADDYARMVRMGANYQVIRLALGQLSEFPGCELEPAYLAKLDGLVKLGREAGLATVFKMTTYGAKSFKWENFWANEHNEFNLYQDAWQAIWTRYADQPSVLGYDLINEPRRYEMDISYDDLTSQYLLPYHRALIDAKNKISPEKVAICQAIFMNKGEGIEHNQYAEIKEPLDRPNAYFSPHIYLDNREWVAPVLARLEKEADLWNAPMFVGEWGFPTYDHTDTSFEDQQEYTRLYAHTADAFDALGVGTIKAWFSGNRTMQDFLPKGKSTWAIFSDKQDVGTVERKYIIDVIARPYPQTIAGDIQSFAFDYATRSLRVDLVTDNCKGASRIFIGANRHYPDGFSVVCGDDVILCHDPLKTEGLTVFKAPSSLNPQDFIWNARTQQLTILRWPVDKAATTLRIIPGINNDL